VLDVWEGEPETDRRLVDLVDIATPHIAGYSVDGKANATVSSVREVAAMLDIPLTEWSPALLPQPDHPVIDLSDKISEKSKTGLIGRAVMHTYPMDEDDRLFRNDPGKFEYLRDNYRIRREFGSYSVIATDNEVRTILADLGFKIFQ